MKYMEKGGFQNHPQMKLTLGLTLLFLVGLWITNFMMYFSNMGLTPNSVAEYYLGSEANFTLPRSYQSMLETTHFHLPMMAIVILMLTHLIIFAPFTTKTKVALILTSFLSAFVTELSSWLIRFVSPHFAILKIASFLVFQGMLALLLISLGWYISMPKKTKKRKKPLLK